MTFFVEGDTIHIKVTREWRPSQDVWNNVLKILDELIMLQGYIPEMDINVIFIRPKSN